MRHIFLVRDPFVTNNELPFIFFQIILFPRFTYNKTTNTLFSYFVPFSIIFRPQVYSSMILSRTLLENALNWKHSRYFQRYVMFVNRVYYQRAELGRPLHIVTQDNVFLHTALGNASCRAPHVKLIGTSNSGFVSCHLLLINKDRHHLSTE